MISFKHRGSFTKTERLFNRILKLNYLNILDKYGQEGVRALASATPVNSGKTANSWTYEISHSLTSTTITWLNTNVNQRVNIAIILQYGHGTGTGGFVQGQDYINPAIKAEFETY